MIFLTLDCDHSAASLGTERFVHFPVSAALVKVAQGCAS